MEIDGFRRTFLSVLGFQQPKSKDSREQLYSPTGDQVVPAINLDAGFGIAFVQAKPGQGVMMHVHDTNETFMVVDGAWRLTWEGDKGDDYVDLGPRDFISFPPNIQRQFQCIQAPDGKEKGTLLGIILGRTSEGTPAAVEYSPQAESILAAEEAKRRRAS